MNKRKILITIPAAAMAAAPFVAATPASAYGWTNQTQARLAQYQNMQVRFKQLLQEHAVVGGWAFIARYDKSPQEKQLRDMVNDNTQKIADLAGNIYGQEDKNRFYSLWDGHIEMLAQYADAARTKDSNKQQQLVQELNTAADQMADFFYPENRQDYQMNISRDQLRSTIWSHINMEKTIIDTHAAGDNTRVQQLLAEACNHAATMADQIWAVSPAAMQPDNRQANNYHFRYSSYHRQYNYYQDSNYQQNQNVSADNVQNENVQSDTRRE